MISWSIVASVLVALIIFSGLRALVAMAWAHFEVKNKFKAIERQYDLETERTVKVHK
jgi:hypothetical protein